MLWKESFAVLWGKQGQWQPAVDEGEREAWDYRNCHSGSDQDPSYPLSGIQ